MYENRYPLRNRLVRSVLIVAGAALLVAGCTSPSDEERDIPDIELPGDAPDNMSTTPTYTVPMNEVAATDVTEAAQENPSCEELSNDTAPDAGRMSIVDSYNAERGAPAGLEGVYAELVYVDGAYYLADKATACGLPEVAAAYESDVQTLTDWTREDVDAAWAYLGSY